MRCEVTSSEDKKALISREVKVQTYKHVCRGEQKKVNLGYNNDLKLIKVMNNTLIPHRKRPPTGKENHLSQEGKVT